MINIRHKLNDFLFNEGGHIGYSIIPTERKKGYATLMLKLGQKCKELNIHEVLITCDKMNMASAKVIQNNNGILENEIYSNTFSEIIQWYWIEVQGSVDSWNETQFQTWCDYHYLSCCEKIIIDASSQGMII